MAKSEIIYGGSIPRIYERTLGPVYFEPYAVETARRAKRLKPQKILEVACGTGRVTVQLAERLPKTVRITATDISPDMLAVAKKKLSRDKNVNFKVVDAMKLPFANESFDMVICQFGLMFFSNREKAIKEMWRVLKKDGAFIFVVWDKLFYNPVAAAGREILKDFFDGQPPKALGMAFSMANRTELAKLIPLNVDVLIETVNKPCIASSARRLAFAQVDGSSIADFVRKKDAEAIPVLKKKIADAIEENFGNHPVESTMQAIYMQGRKEME